MLKDILNTQIGEVAYLYGKDLAASSDDIMSSKTGSARCACEFTAEAAGFNMLAAKLITGQEVEPMTEEQRANMYAGFDTKDKAAAFFDQSIETLKGAVDSCSEEDLAKPVTAPWGDTMPAHKMVMTAVWHTMYHDGQLNLLQLQHGDDKVHWM